jgi:hypothetical protein
MQRSSILGKVKKNSRANEGKADEGSGIALLGAS